MTSTAVASTAPDQSNRVGRLFRRGHVTRGGRVVGLWRVVRATGCGHAAHAHEVQPSVVVHGLMLAEDGRLLATRLDAHARADLVRVVSESLAEEGRWSSAFAGTRLRAALDDVRLGRGPSAAQMARDAARAASDEAELAGEAHAVATCEVAEVGAWLEGLDGRTLHFVAGEGKGVPDRMLGELWPWLDGGVTPGAPLRRAIERRKGLTRRLSDECLRDPVAFERDLAGGRLRAIAMRACVGPGVSRGWALAAGDLDEALERTSIAARRWLMGHVPPYERARDDLTFSALRMVARLPLAWVPGTEEEWDALVEVLPAVAHATSTCGEDAEAASRQLGAKGRWAEFESRLLSASSDAGLAASIGDMRDVASAFLVQLVEPALDVTGSTLGGDDASDVASAHALLHSGRDLARMLAVSDAWHRRVPALGSHVAGAPGWAAGLPDRQWGDVAVVILTTPSQLVAEGTAGPDADGIAGLSHCVAGYAPHCRQGTSRVASVRRVLPDGRFDRLSTVEFAVTRRGATVGQHRGRANAAPPPEARDAVDAYVATLGAGLIAVDGEAFAPVPWDDEALERAGYDWRVRGAWDAMRDAWRPFLPRSLRDATPAGLTRAWLAATASGTALWRRDPWRVPPRT